MRSEESDRDATSPNGTPSEPTPPTTDAAGPSSDEDPLLDLLERWEVRYRRGEDATPESLGAVPGLRETLRVLIENQKRLYAHLDLPMRPGDESPAGGQELPAFPGHEILAEIGRGGMGVVYKGRDSKLGRIVAIKTIPDGQFASPEQRERFQAEARAVARLRHPNIIAIHAIGEHDKQPYLSLEFAEGGSLAQRLAARPMAPREAAELVETLARAVHAAHQAGVIHRDLKPSNVLLTAEGVPKVSDFGLAKLLDAGSERTASGQVMGSPSYMSPEQAEGHSSRVGPTADIYAMGAILYQALTGRPPFLGESALETLKLVVSSDVVAPRLLRPDIPRDLETICLKCLEKEPSRRYAAALDLADDIRRYLDGRPIVARPVGPIGRFWRWGRRNPRVAGLSAAVFASLLLGIAASTVLAVRAMRAEAATREQRNRAQTAADRFKAVNDFLRNDLLGQASVEKQAVLGSQTDPDLKVRTALDRAAEKIGERFASLPLVEASVRQTIGDSYYELGLIAQARPHLERALELHLEFLGAEDPDTFSAMHSLGAVLRDAGKLDEARRYLVQARDGLRRTKGLDDIETMTAMVDLAELSMLVKQGDSATLLSQTAEWFLQTRLIANPETLRAVESVASLLVRNKQSAEAERLVEAVLDRLRAEVGDENPSSLIATRALASIYTATARPVDAERLWRKALSGQRKALGDKHPETLGTTVLFGQFLMSQNREAEAEDLFLKALRIGREALDRNHMATAVALGYLAGIHVSKGELKKAEGYLIETAEITRIRFGPDHGLTAGAEASVAVLLLFESDYAGAEAYLRDCCTFWVRNHADHEDRWRSELRLGICLLAQKKVPEAQSRLLAFYTAMNPRAGRVSVATPQDLGWLIWRITQLRDEKGGPWNDPALSRLRVDAGLQAIVRDLQFPEDPFAPP